MRDSKSDGIKLDLHYYFFPSFLLLQPPPPPPPQLHSMITAKWICVCLPFPSFGQANSLPSENPIPLKARTSNRRSLRESAWLNTVCSCLCGTASTRVKISAYRTANEKKTSFNSFLASSSLRREAKKSQSAERRMLFYERDNNETTPRMSHIST